MNDQLIEAVTDELLAHGEFSSTGNNRPNARAAAQAVIDIILRSSADSADDLRSAGWMVAVHNDYRLNGKPHTFWLFTKGDRAIKGEGDTDQKALDQCRALAGAEPQSVPLRGPDCACCEQRPRKDCTVPGCTMKDAEWALERCQAESEK
jgi:hypothetical protein